MLVEIPFDDVALPQHFARVLRGSPGDDIDKSGLAGPVEADNAYVFSVIYGQIRVIEQQTPVERVRQPFYLQYAHVPLRRYGRRGPLRADQLFEVFERLRAHRLGLGLAVFEHD